MMERIDENVNAMHNLTTLLELQASEGRDSPTRTSGYDSGNPTPPPSAAQHQNWGAVGEAPPSFDFSTQAVDSMVRTRGAVDRMQAPNRGMYLDCWLEEKLGRTATSLTRGDSYDGRNWAASPGAWLTPPSHGWQPTAPAPGPAPSGPPMGYGLGGSYWYSPPMVQGPCPAASGTSVSTETPTMRLVTVERQASFDEAELQEWADLLNRRKKKPTSDYCCHICFQTGEHLIQDCPKKNDYGEGRTPYRGPKKCFGQFQCPKCKRKWSSGNSFAETTAQCKKCLVDVLPFKQIDLNKAIAKGLHKPRQRGGVAPPEEYQMRSTASRRCSLNSTADSVFSVESVPGSPGGSVWGGVGVNRWC